MSDRPRVIAIVGPTASGKSDLADRVAVRLGSSVVSVDSMQVYRGMDIGTAKTPVGERNAPLLMVDVAEVGEDYSVRRFQSEARSCVDGLLGDGKVPILCGGTGLYLDAVIDEMDFPEGETNGPTRSRYEDYAERHGSAALYDVLRSRDPASAELIHPNNVRRVARALEMLDGGTSYAKKHSGLRRHEPHYDALIFGIRRPREELYRRIDSRVELMFDFGLVDEVRGLCDRGLRESTTAGQAIGYKEVLAYLDGKCSLEDCVESVKAHSRHYAKRQLSWLRRDGRTRWIDLDAETIDDAVDEVVSAYQDVVLSHGYDRGDV